MTFISPRVTHIIAFKSFRLVLSKHKIQRQKNKITGGIKQACRSASDLSELKSLFDGFLISTYLAPRLL